MARDERFDRLVPIDGTPLERGTLKVADAPGAAEQATRDIPAPGEVWVDAPLLDALGLAMGGGERMKGSMNMNRWKNRRGGGVGR